MGQARSEETDSPFSASNHSRTQSFSAASLPNAAKRSSDKCGGWTRFASGTESASARGRSLHNLLAEDDDLGEPEVVGVKLCCLASSVGEAETLGAALGDTAPALDEGPGATSVTRSPSGFFPSFVAGVAKGGAVCVGVAGASPPADGTLGEIGGSPPAETTGVVGKLVP